ncbi:DUF4176 domain-containing protein [Bifidobacterium sp. ESL0775]|uniref:DUF4176 domain-containing protein n=1 Tax=Bifidobacterium sp. ESL0775 TaxID=2983230 RepID=UPI0023F6CFE2|nr:DUF4176 domain-containing protein [Bifidobacterium sp. ESL0775]WEV69757.1 DUF4176 domain-containing protein [Bifidobacterium sp. ESL0775]
MKAVDFLPLGTICSVEGFNGRMMIIARGEAVKFPDGPRYFDYGGCLWPEGLIADRMAYFNAEGIIEVFTRGFSDDADVAYVKKINTVLEQVDLPRGNPTSPRDGDESKEADDA